MKRMKSNANDVLLLFFFIGNCLWPGIAITGRNEAEKSSENFPVNVGLMLDLSSPQGIMAELSIDIALSDFYTIHSDYRTRLNLHKKDAKDVITAAAAALELLEEKDVEAIIGLQNSTEASFVVELGAKAQVPVLSFYVSTPSFSPKTKPYFIRTTPNDVSQVKAITAIVKGFSWNDIVFLYEDTDDYKDFIHFLVDEFQECGINPPFVATISSDASHRSILEELNKVAALQTRVFLVHAGPSLGSRIFDLANSSGMISKGSAWIITDALSNFLDSMDEKSAASMEGALGIRPFVPKSESLENFNKNWTKSMLLTKPDGTSAELNSYGLYAYDTAWALAMAVEKAEADNNNNGSFKFFNTTSKFNNNNNNSSDKFINFRISQTGPILLGEIMKTRFKGLSGEFQLIHGEIKPSANEIFNKYEGGERVVGYWTSEAGISRDLIFSREDKPINYSTSVQELKKIIWPGDTTEQPLGWSIPGPGRRLRVGVPVKKGFLEFVKVFRDPLTKEVVNVTGFCIDIFKEACNITGVNVQDIDWIAFGDSTDEIDYDHLVCKIPEKAVDIVVGDTTIVSNRASHVDFTLPYSQSGIVMVAPVKRDKLKDMWIFVKPFTWNLWVTIGSSYLLMVLAFRFLERLADEQPRLKLLVWFPLLALTFPNRKMVDKKWSLVVLVTWMVMSYVLVQSYTATLASILTVGQLQPVVPKDCYVGYQGGSFVKNVLTDKLKIQNDKLKNYSSVEEYHNALRRGGKNDGVDVIYDEIPYIKVFLHKYGSRYRVVGSTYNTEGFGFAFASGSPWATSFSKAILKVIEGTGIGDIERNNFGFEYSLSDDNISPQPEEGPRLGAYSFAGPFFITGFITLLAVCCSEWPRFVGVAKDLIKKFVPSGSPAAAGVGLGAELGTRGVSASAVDLGSSPPRTSSSRSDEHGPTTNVDGENENNNSSS